MRATGSRSDVGPFDCAPAFARKLSGEAGRTSPSLPRGLGVRWWWSVEIVLGISRRRRGSRAAAFVPTLREIGTKPGLVGVHRRLSAVTSPSEAVRSGHGLIPPARQGGAEKRGLTTEALLRQEATQGKHGE